MCCIFTKKKIYLYTGNGIRNSRNVVELISDCTEKKIRRLSKHMDVVRSVFVIYSNCKRKFAKIEKRKKYSSHKNYISVNLYTHRH